MNLENAFEEISERLSGSQYKNTKTGDIYCYAGVVKVEGVDKFEFEDKGGNCAYLNPLELKNLKRHADDPGSLRLRRVGRQTTDSA